MQVGWSTSGHLAECWSCGNDFKSHLRLLCTNTNSTCHSYRVS